MRKLSSALPKDWLLSSDNRRHYHKGDNALWACILQNHADRVWLACIKFCNKKVCIDKTESKGYLGLPNHNSTDMFRAVLK